MNNQVRISRLRAQFLRKNIKVTDDWLEGCAQYFLEQTPGITDDELLEEATQQYLLADLHEAGLPTIPQAILNSDDIQTIEGRFVLQMQWIMNVSESPYDQLQQLYKKQVDETDEERQRWHDRPRKKRMLKLELTDGINKVIGMEYSMIPILNVNLRPGIKLRIVGPLKCVDHILFLESKNVEILGGEVDTLLITYAFENMLLRALQREINPNPQTEYTEVITQNSGSFRETGINGMITPINGSINVSSASNRPLTNGFGDHLNYANDRASTAVMSSNFQNNDPFGDDDFLEGIDLNTIETQAVVSNPTSTYPSSNRFNQHQYMTDDFSDEDDIDALADIEKQVLAEQREQRACPKLDPTLNTPGSSRQSLSSSTKRPSTSPLLNNVINSNEPPSKISKSSINVPIDMNFDEFDSMVHGSRFRKEPTPLPVPSVKPKIKFDAIDYKYRLERCNLLTFEQLHMIPKESLCGKEYIFFANIDKVSKALSIIDNQWKLNLYLIDGCTFEAQVDPDLLERLIGYSAQEIKLMKQKVKNQPALREEIINVLQDFDSKLRSSTKFWKIRFPDASSSNEIPCVISVSDLKPVYKSILLSKIEAEQLSQLKTMIPS